jgi:hypothetical protein
VLGVVYAWPEGNDVVPMESFQQGDVYIDYSFEDAKFRYEHATSRVFCRFNSREEVAVGYTDGLFRDAMRSGTQIDREQYFGD